MKKRLAIAGICLSIGILTACEAVTAQETAEDTQESSLARQSVKPSDVFTDVEYLRTPQRALHLDIYLHPDAHHRPVPLLVYFHGGGWARGAPPESWTGFRRYLNAGFSVATVEYRLSWEARAPAAIQDARCALQWLGTNSAKFGVDPARIVVSGTSAGGHIALMAGLLAEDNGIDVSHCASPARVAAILDFYGPTDLTVLKSKSGQRHSTVVAFTGDGEEGERVEKLVSPVFHVTADSPPVFIAHGTADPIVPVDQSYQLKAKLEEVGVPYKLSVVPGGGHGKFGEKEQAAIMDDALGFLREQGVISSNQ